MPADGGIAAALPGMLMQRGDAKIEVQGCYIKWYLDSHPDSSTQQTGSRSLYTVYRTMYSG